jgi:type IX secretion system PorP/SprF family membrane protein
MKKLLILLVSCFCLNIGQAQDFHYSMYDSGPLFLNPALTGVVDGVWRIHLQHRTQWKAVNFKPYNNSLISFDMPVGKWGFGAQIMNARAGIGNYNALQGLISVGYTVPVSRNKAHVLSFGVQGGVTQKTVEYLLHTFNNQYITSNGGGFDNSLSNGESFASNKEVVPVVNAGIMYYYARQQSKLNPFIGISSFNLLEPKESFFNANNKLPMRHYLHAGVRINITELFYLLPKVLIMQQGKANEQTLACDAGFFLKNSEMWLLGGLVYRNKDAAILSLGLRKKNYIGKVSYDFNTSSLSPTSNGRGGIEVSFTYIKTKEESREKKICPRL